MKDLTKVFIDLSKLSGEHQKHLKKLTGFKMSYIKRYPYLQIIFGEWNQSDCTHLEGKTELTYPEFIKMFEGGEGENPYRPMTEFPPITEGEQHSKMVLVFDEDLDDCDLGFYNFDTQKWDILGDFQMNLICWRHIEKPKYEDVQEYPTILTD